MKRISSGRMNMGHRSMAANTCSIETPVSIDWKERKSRKFTVSFGSGLAIMGTDLGDVIGPWAVRTTFFLQVFQTTFVKESLRLYI
jgi:hypothetical protein